MYNAFKYSAIRYLYNVTRHKDEQICIRPQLVSIENVKII